MAPKDRTSEFHSTLASIKSRSSLPSTSSSAKGKSEAKQPLIPKENGRSTPKPGQGSKSEFGRMAGGIAKDINSTTLKLQKLAQCTFFLSSSDQFIMAKLMISGKAKDSVR